MNPLLLWRVFVPALFLLFMVTQVIWPLVKGTPVLPFFRPSRRSLEGKLAEAQEEVEEALLEHLVDDKLDLANELRHQDDADFVVLPNQMKKV
jgi:hypothetical protein